MNADLRGLFTDLEPPPGGAERFAQRLDAETAAAPAGRRPRRWAAAAASMAIALTAAVVWLRDPTAPPPEAVADAEPAVDVYDAPELDRLLGRPLRPAEPTVMLGAETLPVTQLETTNEKVRIYRLDDPATPAPPPP